MCCVLTLRIWTRGFRLSRTVGSTDDPEESGAGTMVEEMKRCKLALLIW